MLNLLGCLDKPTSGEFFLGDDNVAKMDRDQLNISARRGSVRVPLYNLIQHTRCWRNIEVPLLIRGDSPKGGADLWSRSWPPMVGLGRPAEPPSDAAFGRSKQRVAIAAAW